MISDPTLHDRVCRILVGYVSGDQCGFGETVSAVLAELELDGCSNVTDSRIHEYCKYFSALSSNGQDASPSS